MCNRYSPWGIFVRILPACLLFLTSLLVARPAAAQTAATFGQTYQGAIAEANEVDTYTVSAQAGDVLVARMSKSSGTLWPRIRLFGPTGLEVLPTTDSRPKDATNASFRATVSGTGTFTFQLSDGFNGTYTGTYGFFVQRVNSPGSAVALEAGKTVQGSIDATAEMDTYTLPLQAGDVLVLRMSTASGNLWPLVRLYSPSGSPVAESYNSVSVDADVTVSATGTYTLLAGDGFRGSYVGSYGLFVQTANRPGNAVPLDFAQSALGAIEYPGVMQTYTLTIPPGTPNIMTLRMRRTYGSLWPRVRIYSPEGLPVGDNFGIDSVDVSATVVPGKVYTALVADGFNGTYIGGYRLMSIYTVPDMIRTLRIAGGLDTATADDLGRLNAFPDAPAGLISALDLLQMLRANSKM